MDFTGKNRISIKRFFNSRTTNLYHHTFYIGRRRVPAIFLLCVSPLKCVRKPGRVLFSPKAIRVITFPASFSAERRAGLRYKIRKSATSAVDDMAFIHANAKDATTRLHVEREVERLAMAVRPAGGPPRRLADAGRVARKAPPGGEPFHIQIEREVGRIAAPTDAVTGSPGPVPDPTSGEPRGPDSGRHSGTGRRPSVRERLARWSRSNLMPACRQGRPVSG